MDKLEERDDLAKYAVSLNSMGLEWVNFLPRRCANVGQGGRGGGVLSTKRSIRGRAAEMGLKISFLV